ncbi:MAG TPA: hypothetical protein VFU22_05595 [Roseiflexaceae bacterium]|nr:hypothetical protein [Roseiflexaceae bacterium]
MREALDRHHIAYSGLDVREICLPDPHCIIGDGTRTFSTVVIGRVTVHGAETYHGQLTCYDRRGDCYLYLPALGIQRMPLRNLRGVRRLPRPLAQLWQRGVAWVRGRL